MPSPTKTASKKPAAAKEPAKAAAPTTKAKTVKAASAPVKAPAKTVAKKPAVAAKPATGTTAKKAARGNGASRRAAVTPEQRRNYVEVAAYFIAERNGFLPGSELEHWAAAEAEIDRLLTAGLLNP